MTMYNDCILSQVLFAIRTEYKNPTNHGVVRRASESLFSIVSTKLARLNSAYNAVQ